MDADFSKTEGPTVDVGPVDAAVDHRNGPQPRRRPAGDGIRLGYHWLCLLTICLVGASVYAQTIHYPFVFDDNVLIIDNPPIRMTHFNLKGIYEAGFRGLVPNRPVSGISFALNYFFWGYNVTAFRLVSLSIHLLSGMLVYFISFLTLVRLSAVPGQKTLAPDPSLISIMSLFAAAVFIAHPVQVQAVTYLTQRMTSLAVMFYLGSLLCYLQGRLTETRWRQRLIFTFCLFFGILAFGSKEIAATLPLIILLYEWYFFQNLKPAWLGRGLIHLFLSVVLLVLLTYFFSEGHPFGKVAHDYPILAGPTPPFTEWERVMTQFRVIIFYISMLLFPHPDRLNLLNYITTSHSLVDPGTTLCSLLSLTGLFGLAAGLARRYRFISFCILWFLINLAIEAVVPRLEMIYLYRLYLPLVGFAMLAAYLLFGGTGPRLWLRVATAAVIVFTLGYITIIHNRIWQDNLTLWSDVVAKNPQSQGGHHNLGLSLFKKGKIAEAIDEFHLAARYNPDNPDTQIMLGAALAEQGNYRQAARAYTRAVELKPDDAAAHQGLALAQEHLGHVPEAMRHYLEALRIKPDHYETYRNLGHLLAENGRIAEALGYLFEALRARADWVEARSGLEDILADPRNTEKSIRFFAQAIQLEPNNADAHYFLGLALVKYGDTGNGAREAGEALRLRPGFAEAHNSLGAVLLSRGDIDGAVKQFSEAARINPEYSGAQYNLGIVLAGRGDIQGAINHYLEALKIKPDYAEAYNNLGAALAGQGKIKEAAANFSEAVRFNPDYAMAHNNLGMTLMDQGKVPEAAKQFSEAVRINPDFPEAQYNLGRALMALGRTDQAIRCFSEALRLIPDFAEARRSLEQASGKH
ncbi:MAG: tetratricopeptide repeat protein [Deltaproteobacteria bacterium]|nr:tetratricopeptide repeat protein [Deltaproteobacteria bacterium]